MGPDPQDPCRCYYRLVVTPGKDTPETYPTIYDVDHFSASFEIIGAYILLVLPQRLSQTHTAHIETSLARMPSPALVQGDTIQNTLGSLLLGMYCRVSIPQSRRSLSLYTGNLAAGM